MKKVLRIFLIFVGVFLIVFGLVGGIIELSSEGTGLFGIVLATVFIILGGFLLHLGIRGRRDETAETEETAESDETAGIQDTAGVEKTAESVELEEAPASKELVKDVPVSGEIRSPLWQRTALIIASWVELVFFALGIIFALIFGVAGFKAGEMGAMVGIMMVLALIGIAIVVSVRIVTLWGLVKDKSWAPVLNLIISVLGAVVLIVSGAWPALMYQVFTGWCSVYLIRHKTENPQH